MAVGRCIFLCEIKASEKVKVDLKKAIVTILPRGMDSLPEKELNTFLNESNFDLLLNALNCP